MNSGRMWSGPKTEKKNWSSQARAKILYFASCRIRLGKKFCFLFRVERGPRQNFYVYFGVVLAHREIQPAEISSRGYPLQQFFFSPVRVSLILGWGGVRNLAPTPSGYGLGVSHFFLILAGTRKVGKILIIIHKLNCQEEVSIFSEIARNLTMNSCVPLNC